MVDSVQKMTDDLVVAKKGEIKPKDSDALPPDAIDADGNLRVEYQPKKSCTKFARLIADLRALREVVGACVGLRDRLASCLPDPDEGWADGELDAFRALGCCSSDPPLAVGPGSLFKHK